MVERPIKRSERPVPAQSPSESQPGSTARTEQETSGRRDRREGGKKGKGRGKRSDQKDAPKAINPALMRGPKPVVSAPVVEEPPAEPEAVESEVAEPEAAEASDTTAVAE
uniref:Uncharacterized protein n=1 Tax=Cyanothece sp. (strain PCC 7425 / ATCC 29141) TaxID=395961 RepID=B8HQ96_CYAP4